jgi:hypothetical protein
MVMDGNGLPWDRAAEEGAQERVQWLHPGEDDRRGQDEAPLIGARSVSCRNDSILVNAVESGRIAGALSRQEIPPPWQGKTGLGEGACKSE